MILGAFDIKYMPRTSIKGQVLADLVVEFTEASLESEIEAQHLDGKSIGSISYKNHSIGRYMSMEQWPKGDLE